MSENDKGFSFRQLFFRDEEADKPEKQIQQDSVDTGSVDLFWAWTVFNVQASPESQETVVKNETCAVLDRVVRHLANGSEREAGIRGWPPHHGIHSPVTHQFSTFQNSAWEVK